jgi:hypothetical protein
MKAFKAIVISNVLLLYSSPPKTLKKINNKDNIMVPVTFSITRRVNLTGGDLTKTSMLIIWLSAIASAFVDNIPFVATMIPMIKDMGTMGITNLEPLWWSLALGPCLGGNGTLIGASANDNSAPFIFNSTLFDKITQIGYYL